MNVGEVFNLTEMNCHELALNAVSIDTQRLCMGHWKSFFIDESCLESSLNVYRGWSGV